MPNTGSENKVLWVPTSITSARLKRALLATRTTPLLNTMARQFAAGVDSAILDTDLSLAIFNGPLTLDMPPPRDEEPVVTVKAEEAVPEPSKQTPPTPVEVEGDAAKTVLPTPPGAFNFSGPLPAGWEAFKNAPYKPLVIEPPRPGAGRHGHRHASGERSAVKGRESHLKQQSEVAPEQETVSFSNTPSSNAGVGPQTTSLFGTPPVKTDLPPLPPPNAQAQKAPVWPSLSPAAHAPVTPLGSIPPLPRKDFLGSLPPVKKDSIDAPQFLIPANNAPSGFVPLLGKQAQGPTAAELQEKAKQAWGNLGSSKSSSSAPSLTWKPPLPTLPSIPVASAAAAPQLPAAWKAALDAQTKPSTPAAPSRSPAAETTRPSEVERTAESVKQEVKPSAPNATAAVDRLSPPPRIANEPITPSIEQGPPKSPDPSTKKAFDFSSFTKNAAAGPKPSGLPSFSDLLKNSGVSLSSAGVANAEPQVSESDALINAPTTPPQAASPNPSLSGIRSPPLQALFGAKSSAAPKSAFGAGGFGMPTSTPAASASAQSAFGPGGLGIAPASSTSAGAVSTSGQGGSGTHSAAPATSTGFKSAFGPGGVGTPAASDGSTTPPGAKSPSPAPIGGTFGMHSGGASGTFGIAAGPTRSLFAKPEGWTPPASSSSNGNIFKPVNVPIPTGVSGNPDWAKRLANSNADEDEDEDEDEDAEGEEDNSYDDYQDEGDYGAYGRDLSDLEEADEEYEVVDE
ncbi:hypothetical protein CALVIDRAFT_283607 [Calocera viscosa TUFC12733]|uniref:Uncharacterized protein n=1 Tax=Calocera viscosa (strain TUFC12733) TaxID=1330018 RepID=A0A167R7Z2_CALVF|nr:hypothetical protein CALVIDRAFT_283607 [Calocera viscosa TUFC12733]